MRDDDAKDVFSKIILFHPWNASLKNDSHFLTELDNTQFLFCDTEMELFRLFVQELLVLDPDILTGFEMQKSSLGYLAERALTMGIHLLK